jgi:ornithine cyclodeaminase/alanine dehydrogenase-like protein (mu-crystallin family)
LHVPLAEGGCHGKAARWQDGARCYVAIKFNANLPSNPQRHGLPTIQGAILLCDGDNGRLLAVLDSIELTLGRTAAATALAARHLARPASRVLAVCGCGAQAWPQVEALRQVLPQLREVRFWDRETARAATLQQRLLAAGGLNAQVAGNLEQATGEADVVVTCTTSTEPYLDAGSVGAGCFVAAVGADSPGKSEITPALMARAKVVVDSRAQCLEMGDLHHAVAAGAIAAGAIHAELADLTCGRVPGRRSDDEIWIFDSTGVAIQDVVSAVRVFERAIDRRVGTAINITC